jgi:Fe-S cluster assembly iron-binding protein IscA
VRERGAEIWNDLLLSEEDAPCLLSYVYEGVRIQIADEVTSLLLRGAEVDYVRAGKDSGFAIRGPKVEEEWRITAAV